jgi:hypothetical protein
MMARLGRINTQAYDQPPTFLTLTYPESFPTDPHVYKGHLRAFLKRLRRAYGARAVIWRLEWQRRGAPHFHVLIFDLVGVGSFKDWCLSSWSTVCDSGDSKHETHGVDVSPMRTWAGVRSYLSKYIAKVDDGSREPHDLVGRVWGVEDAALLVETPVSWTIGYRAAIRLRRTMQKWVWSQGRRTHRHARGGQGERGASAYMSEWGFSALVKWVQPDVRPLLEAQA